MKYDVALFDFDGTIADTQEIVVESIIRTFRDANYPIPARESVIEGMGIPIEKEFSRLAEKELTHEEVQDLLVVFRKHGKEIEQDLLQLFPEMFEVLEQLKAKASLAIVTSKSYDVLVRQLHFLEIFDFFDVIVAADMVQNFKPAPDTALLALEKMAITTTSRVLVIGDSTFDILMGQNAGLATCAVTWGAHSTVALETSEPTHSIDSPRELLQFFD